jgi:hypothetical protein
MSQDTLSTEKTGNGLKRSDIKPFCPIHHWRMAHDSGSNKVGPSYHCNYDGCTVLYTETQGYFELSNPTDARNFVIDAEILCCTYDPQHHPAIVGYAKESVGNRTEEFRQWRCLAPACKFSLRQKLSLGKSAHHRPTAFVPSDREVERDHALWPR